MNVSFAERRKAIKKRATKICKECGKEFRNIRKTLCSPECHVAHIKKISHKGKPIENGSLKLPTESAKTVFDALIRFGHDEDFEPRNVVGWTGTYYSAGSPGKIEVLRDRIERGWPLWHPDDPVDRGAVLEVDFLAIHRTNRPRKGTS